MAYWLERVYKTVTILRHPNTEETLVLINIEVKRRSDIAILGLGVRNREVPLFCHTKTMLYTQFLCTCTCIIYTRMHTCTHAHTHIECIIRYTLICMSVVNRIEEIAS